MAESRGLVKLFGKTITVPAEGAAPVAPVVEADPGGGGGVAEGGGEEGSKGLADQSAAAETEQQDQESPDSEGKSEQQASYSTGSENRKGGPTADPETPPEKDSNQAEAQNNTDNQPEKTVKKPDKILPCPRCSSMDTKFCYYNNYNVNQPRHFCKNCQRYWTAGGTMRNVPVGAGRRKNKHSASHYRNMAIAKAALQPVRHGITELVHHGELKPNGAVLSFSPDTPLCESMASALNLAERTAHGFIGNGFHHPEDHAAPFSRASGGVDNVEEHSSGSSVTVSNSAGDGGGANIHDATVRNCQGYPPQVPCFSGTPWPYPWNAAPAFCASSLPISFYPMTPYWGGCSVPSAWSVPCLVPLSSSPPNSGSAGSGSNSPTLGKHSRDGDALTPNSSEKGDVSEQTEGERCLWIPKTLRIDDPEEAAKSSLWTTMGFKHDKADRISKGGLFKPFNQPKTEFSNHAAESSQVLHANPAALLRSLNFHENS